MLDMFKRPDDPPEYYHLYGIPGAAALGLYGVGSLSGKFPEIDSAAGTLAGLLCIGGIAGLASQKTARLGAVSGQSGVALGVASTLGHLSPGIGTTAYITALMGAGAVAGKYIGDRVEPTSLPQTVAAFHSLVGLAASAAAIGDYLNTPDTTQLDGVHLASIYLATVIGAVTFTGSLGKKAGCTTRVNTFSAALTRVSLSHLSQLLSESLMDGCLLLPLSCRVVTRSIWVLEQQLWEPVPL